MTIQWAYPGGAAEAVAISLFGLLYLGYLLRTWRLAAPLEQRGWRLFWKLPLRLFYFGLLLVAWRGPAYGLARQAVRTAGKDVWLVVDVSRSMDAPDVAPTRLQKARAELARLIEQFQADRIGLLVFGSEAVVQCPLTYDQSALLLFLNGLQTSLLPPGPTDLAPPLELALRRLAATPPPAGAPPRALALVVVSDGEDFGDNLEPVLREVARAGVRIFAVGVGTSEGSRIPRAGGGYVRDQRGRDAITRLESTSLRRLAAQTNGRYFELTAQRNEFRQLVTALNQVEGQPGQVRTVSVADNRYRYPLLLALALLLLDVLVTVRVIRL